MRRGGALVVLILMMMRGSGGRVMRVDRVHVQLIGHALGLLEPVISLHRRRWLHGGEMREGLQSALIARAVTGLLGLPMRRRQALIVVRTVTGGRGTPDGPHRRRTAAAAAASATAAGRRGTSANLMLQIRLVGENVLQVVRRVMVMIAAAVAGRGVRRGEIREEHSQIIAPRAPHRRGDAAHASVHVLVGLLMMRMLLRILQMTVRGR